MMVRVKILGKCCGEVRMDGVRKGKDRGYARR